MERYSISDGLLDWAADAHAGDVNSIDELRPGLLCTAGSDCRVRRHLIGPIPWALCHVAIATMYVTTVVFHALTQAVGMAGRATRWALPTCISGF